MMTDLTRNLLTGWASLPFLFQKITDVVCGGEGGVVTEEMSDISQLSIPPTPQIHEMEKFIGLFWNRRIKNAIFAKSIRKKEMKYLRKTLNIFAWMMVRVSSRHLEFSSKHKH